MKRPLVVLTVIFGVLSALFASMAFLAPSVDYRVLLAGNTLLFAVTVFSYRQNLRALSHQSVHGFLRIVYGSFFLKLVLVAAATLFYALHERQAVNKPALFGCLALYFLYTFAEVRLVMQQRKK